MGGSAAATQTPSASRCVSSFSSNDGPRNSPAISAVTLTRAGRKATGSGSVVRISAVSSFARSPLTFAFAAVPKIRCRKVKSALPPTARDRVTRTTGTAVKHFADQQPIWRFLKLHQIRSEQPFHPGRHTCFHMPPKLHKAGGARPDLLEAHLHAVLDVPFRLCRRHRLHAEGKLRRGVPAHIHSR